MRICINGGKWKTFDGGDIPPGERIEITGDEREAQGVLVFRNGGAFSARRPAESAALSPLDHARFIIDMGVAGVPLHHDGEALAGRHREAVMETLESYPLVALRFLEALHKGDPGFFRKVAKAIRESKKIKSSDEILKADDDYLLARSILRAAGNDDQIPMVENVAIEWQNLSGIPIRKRDQKALRLELFKKKLNAAGWGWLPHRKQGDTLRR